MNIYVRAGYRLMKNSGEDIGEVLGEMPDTWFIQGKDRTIAHLLDFLQLLGTRGHRCASGPLEPGKGTLLSEGQPIFVPYNSSPFHFFLYYAPPPNFPFAIFGDRSVMFGSFGGRDHDKLFLSFPFFEDVDRALVQLEDLLTYPGFATLLREKRIWKIQLRDIGDRFVNSLRDRKEGEGAFSQTSLKEMKYSIYDAERTLKLKGSSHANLRWHINRFEHSHHRLEALPLAGNERSVRYLIGEWRRTALKGRGFSYVDVRSDSFGARLFSSVDELGNDSDTEGRESDRSIGSDDVIARVLRVDGKVASFNLGFPLGLFGKKDVFAHAIGISDIKIPGLAEYAQLDFWKQIVRAGYRYVNDGSTWRRGLAAYKKKFVPINTKRYYWATLLIK